MLIRHVRRPCAACCLVLIAAVALSPAAPPEPSGGTARELTEQSIYIPYDKLWEVFEKQGRGVFVPYEAFDELWESALKATRTAPDPEPPVAALLSELRAEARVSGDVVQVDAVLRADVLRKGWHRIPLRLQEAAVTRVDVDGRDARLMGDRSDGYALLVHNPSESAVSIEIRLSFARSFETAPGRNSVTFQSPLAPMSRWDVTVPERGVEVRVHPVVAVTAPAGAEREGSRLTAFVGPVPEVTIEWTPRAQGARGLRALLTAESRQSVTIDEGVLRSVTRMDVGISRQKISELGLRVPAGYRVVNVFDENVREWSIVETNGQRRVDVRLFDPAEGAQPLAVELERFDLQETVRVPVVAVEDAVRQTGVVTVDPAATLRARVVRRSGVWQVDPSELETRRPASGARFGFRYSAVPYELELQVEKIEPRIEVDALTRFMLEPDALTADIAAVYDVQRAGVFDLALTMPPGFEVRSVAGMTADGVQPAAVDEFRVEQDGSEGGPGRLVVKLARRAEGRVGLRAAFLRRLQMPDLLSPTGAAVELDLPLPRAAGPAVERDKGHVILSAPESLRIRPTRQEGLRAVPHADARGDMPIPSVAGLRPVLSFAYADQAVALAVEAERRAPQVAVRQLLVAEVESGVARYEARFHLDVRYSGVRGIRIDVPRHILDGLRLATGGVRMQVLSGDDAPADTAEGYRAVRITGETEFLGESVVTLMWEHAIEQLDIGRSVNLEVPRLVPRGVDRSWGHIVLAKAEAVDVAPEGETAGLNPVDPRHDVPGGTAVRGAAWAYEFHDAWRLAVRATRYELKDVKATSIERGLVRVVMTRGDIRSVQALYRMRSVRQRLAVRLPGEIEDSNPVRLNGRPVPLEKGEDGVYLIPLSGEQRDTPFLLELRYVVRDGGTRVAIPGFPMEPAGQRVYLSLYYPKAYAYLGHRGAWSDEFVWVLDGFNSYPRAARSAEWLLEWVTSGTDVAGEDLSGFATDGRHLLYSALRPAGGAEGGPRPHFMRNVVFQAVILVAILAVGLLLVPCAAPVRITVIGAAVVGLVVLAVFLPSLARAAVTNATAGAGFSVLAVWTVWHLVVVRPRRRSSRGGESQTPPSGPPPIPGDLTSAPANPAADEEERDHE